MASTCGSLHHLAFFYQLAVFRAALKDLEGALFLDHLRGVARVVTAVAHGLDEARTLNTPTEFSDDIERGLIPAFCYFCIYAHPVRSRMRNQSMFRTQTCYSW